MPAYVLMNPHVSINGVDLSNKVRSVTINDNRELVDGTAGGDTGRRKFTGLAEWSADIEFYSDEDLASVAATLAAALDTEVPFVARPTSGPVGPTNREYRGNGRIASAQPFGGTIGEMAMSPIRIEGSDGQKLIIATS